MAQVHSTSKQELLKQLVPLNILTDEALDRLAQQIDVEQLKRGSFLFRQGDTEPCSIYLLAGTVQLLSGDKEVDAIKAGTKTARFALAHQLPRKLSARAKSQVECIRIDSHLLSELVAQSRQDSYDTGLVETEPSDDWMTQLLQSGIFQHIPPSNIQSVMRRMEEHAVTKGERVITEGEKGDYYYLINRGICSVTRNVGKGVPPVELARLGPGQSFGEEALLSDGPRGSTVTMLTDGKLLRLSKQNFNEFIKNPLAKGIDYPEAAAIVKEGGVWLDVRSPEEYAQSHVTDSINFPFATLRLEASSLNPEPQYVIYCGKGSTSIIAAFLLVDRGFDVLVLNRGIDAVPPEAISYAGKTAEKKRPVSSSEIPSPPPTPAKKTAVVEEGGDAEERIRSLEQRLQQLRAEQEYQQQERSVEIEELKLMLEESGDALERTEREKQEALSAARTLNKKLETTLNELKEAHAVLDEYRTKVEESSTVTQLNETSLADSHDLIEELEDKLTQKEKQITELKRSREALKTELADLAQIREVQETFMEDFDHLTAEKKELEIRLAESLKTCETGREELSAAQVQLKETGFKLKEAEDQKKAAEGRVEGLSAQVEELRTAVQEQAEHIQVSETGSEDEKMEALRAELELVRNRALTELEEMRKALDEARAAHTGQDNENSADAMDREIVRQEMETLQGSLAERERELEQSREEQQALEDSLEDSNDQMEKLLRETEQLRERVEQAESAQKEAEQARLEEHALLEQLRLEVEEARVENSLVLPSPRIKRPLDIQEVGKGSSLKTALIGALVGALLIFGGLEALMIVAGKGEIISNITSSAISSPSWEQ